MVGQARLTFIVIEYSINSGIIDGNIGPVGGIVAMVNRTIKTNEVLNIGTVITSGDYSGGLIGYSNDNINLFNSYNTGDISGNDMVGGLIGYAKASSTLSRIYNTGTISGITEVGGLIGKSNQFLNIYESYNEGIISGNGYIGGIVGSGNLEIYIYKSYNIGVISGVYYIGGIYGGSFFYSSKIVIADSYNSGNIVASGYKSGGLVGRVITIEVSNAFNNGNISGYNEVGGLVGDAEKMYVSYVVNFGLVTSTSTTENVGGIIGRTPTDFDTEEVYYIQDVISNGVSVEGILIGTKQTDLSIFTNAFFTDTLLWDDKIWDLTNIDIATGVYPTLIVDKE